MKHVSAGVNWREFHVRVDRVEVIGVAHQRREPGYWKYRLGAERI